MVSLLSFDEKSQISITYIYYKLTWFLFLIINWLHGWEFVKAEDSQVY